MNDRKKKIIVVDDDVRLRDLLDRYLSENGFEVVSVANSVSMDKHLSREHFDLIVLDLMLAGENGLEICRRLRGSNNSMPIMMLTAKGDEIDRIIGLEMGADDYLPKPFNPRELLARIQAILRRNVAQPPGSPDALQKVVKIGAVEINLNSRTLTKSGEAPVALTTGEFALLKAFIQNSNQPLSRDKLMTLARGRDHNPFDRAIDVQISRLRKLIEPDSTHPRYLQTVWGFGYVYVPDEVKPES